jgi:single-strand DNA-binding protein
MGRTKEPSIGSDGAAHRSELHRNEIRLIGRLSAPARVLDLPSGDRLVTFRVIVDRPGPRQSRAGRDSRADQAPARGGSPRRVDTIDCATWTRREQRRVERWRPGDLVEVQGHLRRRFRRGDSGPVSRVEVEVTLAKKVG